MADYFLRIAVDSRADQNEVIEEMGYLLGKAKLAKFQLIAIEDEEDQS